MKITTSVRKFRSAEAIVVVDVFRSSATICYGLRNGMTELRAVDKLKQVFDVAEKNDLKIGEKRGMRPAGFDFSNSPTQMLSEKIRGRRAVFCSTNLAHVLNSNGPHENVFIGTFCNAHALAKHLKKFHSVNFVACSSPEWDIFFRFEDLAGIGKILQELEKFEAMQMDGFSKISLWIYKNFKTKSLLLNPNMYSTALIGGVSDINLCSKENSASVVPVCKYENGFVSIKSI